MEITIDKGDHFVCKENVLMTGTLEIRYQAGLVYKSEEDGCITDDNNCTTHRWITQEKISKHFKKL